MNAIAFAAMRDENGFYTKLQPTDPCYPYGGSEDAAAAPLAVDLSTEVLDLSDERVDGVLGVGESDGEQDLGLVVAADVAEDLQGAAASAERAADLSRLRLGVVDVAHDAFPSVRDGEVAPSSSICPTVGDTADTSAGVPSGSREAGGDGTAARVSSVVPSSEQGGIR